VRVFSFFTEPAAYTLDLIENVYKPMGINYCFLEVDTEVYTKSYVRKNNILSDMSFFNKLKYIISIRKEYDLIILNSYDTFVFFLVFLFNIFSLRRRYIAIESDTQLSIPTTYFKKLIKWLYLSIIFRHKYVLGFAGGNFTHKDLFRYYGMNEKQIFLMPMMIDNNKFFCTRKSITPFTFLYVGRIIAIKNIEALIRQFNIYFNDKDAILRIVGEGELDSYLKSTYSSKKVQFAGKKFDDNLIKEFHNASVLICPSLFEPWGLVVNEALSAGLPVIARKEVGATYDLLNKRETGFIVSNDKEMGERMMELFLEKIKLQLFSTNAVSLMKNYWNYDLYRDSMDQVFQSIKMHKI